MGIYSEKQVESATGPQKRLITRLSMSVGDRSEVELLPMSKIEAGRVIRDLKAKQSRMRREGTLKRKPRKKKR